MAHARTFRHHGEHAAATPEFITKAEAGEILGLTERTVHNMILRGDLVAYRVGPKAVRLVKADVYAVAIPVAVAR